MFRASRIDWLRTSVLTLVVGALAIPTGLGAPPGTSKVRGTLFNASGQEIAGARVVLTPLEHPEHSASTMTDTRGRYELEGVRYGLHQVGIEANGVAYVGNRVLTIPPKRNLRADFTLSEFREEDRQLGLNETTRVAGLDKTAGGIARLSERVGPSGWAWFTTGKGVAVLVGGGAALVAGLIALSDDDEPQRPVSPSTP
jgi:hypothetical protein